MKKFVALAALLIGGVYFVQHSTAPPSPPASPSPHTVETTALPWLQLRQGVKAYTGDNGGGDDFLTVCPTAALYKKWSSSPNAVVPQCNDKARGVPVTIGSDEISPERDVTDQVYGWNVHRIHQSRRWIMVWLDGFVWTATSHPSQHEGGGAPAC